MGRSYTPTYRVEQVGGDFPGMMGWSGKPTPERLERYILDLCRSTEPGGINAHIGKSIGRIANPPRVARIVRQSTGEVVAEWKHPPFLVL